MPHATKPNTSDIRSTAQLLLPQQVLDQSMMARVYTHVSIHMYIHRLTHEYLLLCTCIIIQTGADLGFSEGGAKPSSVFLKQGSGV